MFAARLDSIRAASALAHISIGDGRRGSNLRSKTTARSITPLSILSRRVGNLARESHEPDEWQRGQYRGLITTKQTKDTKPSADTRRVAVLPNLASERACARIGGRNGGTTSVSSRIEVRIISLPDCTILFRVFRVFRGYPSVLVPSIRIRPLRVIRGHSGRPADRAGTRAGQRPAPTSSPLRSLREARFPCSRQRS